MHAPFSSTLAHRARKGECPRAAIRPTDAEIAELAAAFRQEMPRRVAVLERLWAQQRLDELQRAARDLAMVCAGLGFAEVASAAGNFGRTITDLVNGRPVGEGGGIEALRRDFGAIVTGCRGLTAEASHS